jgi:hypothetical protein
MLATGAPSARLSACVSESFRTAGSAGEVAKNLNLFFPGISLTKAQVARFGGYIARFGSVYDDARDAIVMSADSWSRATAFIVENT